MTQATREIMWNIPYGFKVAMYVLFAVSLAVLVKGLIDKYRFVTGGKKFKDIQAELMPQGGNWTNFFMTFVTMGKTPRDKRVGFFHSLIYFGFIILWIATDLVAIHYDTPFKVFQGTTYIVISFLADIAGLAILLGIALAYKRRYIEKPEKLSATKPNQELFMYGMLVVLVVVGYLIEGVRIMGTGMPEGERVWAPVGWLLASIFQNFGLSNASWATIYKGLWFFHMVNTMVFVASIGYSKFFHFLALPAQALATWPHRGAVLEPMNFEDENAETFGLGKLSEMTAKNRFDLISCVECGRCTMVCPANLAGKPLNPKTIVTKARDLAYACTAEGKDAEFWGENPIYSATELDACTTCGACMEECPAHIEHVNIIMGAKRYKTLTLGEIPPEAADAANKVRVNGNPWGIAQDDRFKWADGLDVPLIEPGKKVDYLYYVGCAGSYDAANQKVVKDTIMLLKKAGVDFAVIGKTEKCNGDPVRRFGDEYTFYEIAIENITALNQYDFSKIVTHCPHCLHTLGKEYRKFQDGTFEVVHHTELLADLIRSGKLRPQKSVEESMTFHDPCYLGRHHGEYNAPREILQAVPGIQIKEMTRNKDRSLCCGMGGGNMWYELPGENLAKNRLIDVGQTQTEKLATACSYCMINFNSSKAEVKETEEIEIEDVASVLAKSIE